MPTTQTTHIYDDVPRCAPQFTGKERDTETGLDYFGARYYGSNMARFSSADPISYLRPPSLTIANPQRWNSYSYGLNSPLHNIDVGGLYSAPVHIWITTTAAGHLGYGAGAISRMVKANLDVDSPRNQLRSNWHGMRDAGQSVEEGYGRSGDRMTAKLIEAVQLAAGGRYGDALDALGAGSHTPQDMRAHKMMTLGEHHKALSTDPNRWDEPYNNDGPSVEAAERDTEEYFGMFEANLRLALGDERANQALDSMKNYGDSGKPLLGQGPGVWDPQQRADGSQCFMGSCHPGAQPSTPHR
jgi:RHS repeat-associated protein